MHLLVNVEESDETKMELLELIISWLLSHGFASAAQLLYDETSAQLHDEMSTHKAVSALCRAIDERDWERAHRKVNDILSNTPLDEVASARKVMLTLQGDTSATTTLSLLLLEQQFMELVDEDNGQRAFTFFIRSIKPYESVIGRQRFQKLTYLLTCKTLEEAAKLYPEFRGWTPEIGRAAVKAKIRSIGSISLLYAESRPRHLNIRSSADGQSDLHFIMQQALSFRLLNSRYAKMLHDIQPITMYSYSQQLTQQIPPITPLLSINVNQIVDTARRTNEDLNGNPSHHRESAMYARSSLTCCESFLDSNAIVAGNDTGDILWIPVTTSKTSTSHSLRATEHCPRFIYNHRIAIRGIKRHKSRLLLWGGPKTTILDLTLLMRTMSIEREPTSPLMSTSYVHHIFTHIADACSGAFFPCGSLIATGLAQGTIHVWDVNTGKKLSENNYRSSSVISVIVSSANTTYFAAYKEGVLCVVDVASGFLLQTLLPPMPLELSAIALSPSSSLLLTYYKGGYLRVWNVLTSSLLPIYFTGTENNTRSSIPVSFGTCDEFIFGASEDGSVCFWNTRTAHDRCANTASHTDAIVPETSRISEAKSPDEIQHENNVSLEMHTNIRLGNHLRPVTQLRLHTDCVTDMKINNAHMLTAGKDGMIFVYTSVK